TTHERAYGFPPGHPEMHNFLGVPILVGGEAWGNLYFTQKQSGRFDEADESLAVACAARMAMLIDAEGT
ncbi:MAG TPA: GAF domain-containing protein, partial [Solirubrobacteraceae bacterium]|nr:GAF domain-containing protein [Solirubrobacteraceae bacterium]